MKPKVEMKEEKEQVDLNKRFTSISQELKDIESKFK